MVEIHSKKHSLINQMLNQYNDEIHVHNQSYTLYFLMYPVHGWIWQN